MEIVVALRILNNTGLTPKLLTTNKASLIRIHLFLHKSPFTPIIPYPWPPTDASPQAAMAIHTNSTAIGVML
jgi:hypothetical protein